MEYSSNAKGNLAVTLGAIGTGLSVLGGAGNLFGGISGNNYATKDDLAMTQTLASKDSEIAILKADADSEKKMIEVYKQAHSEIAELRDNTSATFKEMQKEINDNRRFQDAWNASQSVANAQMSAAIATNANSITAIQNTLGSVVKTVIPNSNVCPGWGEVKTTIVT